MGSLCTVTSTENNGTPSYLHGLNTPQQRAVQILDGPLLVLAGAGTGKTRVLTTRIAHILETQDVRPWNVLAVTFTNKAAQEMDQRLQQLTTHAQGVWLGTFHALCLRILRRYAELVNLSPQFTILDTDDQVRLIKQLVRAEDLCEKTWIPRVLAAQISRLKDRGLLPHRVTTNELAFLPPESRETFARLYTQYQERLTIMNVVDFGDLILLCLEIFRNHPEVLEIYQKQFRYILVDEYQDTNVSQYLWLRLLAGGWNNICCVGDDDQSIYGWRGAEVANILRFSKDFPGATVVKLEENYRSSSHILGAATALIACNGQRHGKTLWTARDGGDKVIIQSLDNGYEEAVFVCNEIDAQQHKAIPLSEMAILVRASFQTRTFEERLITLGIPYRVVGGARFYERQEIRDALAYLRVVSVPQDSMAFERIINVPKRGIGTATMNTLHVHSRSKNISLMQACIELLDTDEFKGKTQKTLASLVRDFQRWRQMAKEKTPSDLAKIILDESGYTQHWMKDKSHDSAARLDNLKEFVQALQEYDSIDLFLEHVSLVMDNNADQVSDKVTLMTLHGAKGLEFDVVFLTGWEEDLFPSPKTLKEKGVEGLEEERRLAYVGLTRAKKRAYVTYALSRRMYQGWQTCLPSRFVDELPPEHIEYYSKRHHGAPITAQRGGAAFLKEPGGGGKTLAYEDHWQPGERVFHMKFGYGKIIAMQGDKMDILFEHTGMKKVMASFISKA